MSLLSWCRLILQVLEMHFSRLKYVYAAIVAGVLIVGGGVWLLFLEAPAHFPSNQVITIAPGTSVGREAVLLEEAGVIRSAFVFKVLARLMPGTHGVQSGRYAFSHPVGVITVVWNVTHGVSGIPTIKVTFPEGTTVRQMGRVLAKKIPGFDEITFDLAAVPAEGYLFPDTYFFLPDTTEVGAVDIMRANYATHMEKLRNTLEAFGKSEHDVIIMASLLEGEGKTLEDKQRIAGILWHRIALGMPLQVDATFGYIHGQSGYTPTAADLKMDSAYNTYRYKGLPPGPINNPGDEAIMAAVTPEQTPYLYYLTGTDGHMYYAKTLAEHSANQKKYLQ